MDSTTDTEALRVRFRDAMANLPAAVNIVTTAGAAGRCGITATALCSVSDSPPTLLFCINRNSSTIATFECNRDICVNVLPAGGDELARHFAGMSGLCMEDRFGKAAWSAGPGAPPRLDAALVSLTGRIVEMTPVGTHVVLFAGITDVQVRDDADALVYFDRTFRRIARQAAPAAEENSSA